MIIIIPFIMVIGFLAWMLRPGKKPTISRIVAIMVTAILSFIVALTAVSFQLSYNATGTIEVAEISNTLFIIGMGLIGVYILTSIGFVLAHKGDIAKGMGFGICIAVIVSIIELGLLEWLGEV